MVSDTPFRRGHIAIIAAHCDDEVLGAGGQLATMREVSVIHLTDSAPSERTARAHGFPTRLAYAEAREGELRNALTEAVGNQGAAWQGFGLGLPDGLASFHMAQACHGLARLLGELQPDLVLTHPYEGGHPDHDTAAFATRAALRQSGLASPLWEMTSYHRAGGTLRFGDFLPASGTEVVHVRLSEEARTRKAAALACFLSQRQVVSQFPLAEERFRLAPHYDFGQPPHPGRLNYEGRRRAMSGAGWRALAAREIHGRPLPSIVRTARNAIWRSWLAR